MKEEFEKDLSRMFPKLYIVRTPDGSGFPLPSYPSRNHVGLQLLAAIPSTIKLEPQERVHIPTGFAVGVPNGLCGYVVSLPELVLETGLIVMDAPRLVNPEDRAPLFILIQNASRHQVVLRRGQPVAQLVIMPAYQISWNEVIPPSTEENEQTTNPSDILLDEHTVANPKSEHSKREVKPIRERFKVSDE